MADVLLPRLLPRLLEPSSHAPHNGTMNISNGQYPAESLSGEQRKIRLLTLLPGTGEETVRCTLHSVGFENPESYEALSYEWGRSGSPQAILVNGREFGVGDNLFQALRHLRLPKAERVLWIDAICINQSDLRERNHQVQQMADIYSRAHQVIAWIGLETEDSREAFEFLRGAFAFSPHNRRSLMHHPGWKAVGKLCQRGYWRRVWIVQEICLARRLIVKCGASQIPWKYVSELRMARKQHIWPQYLSHGERTFIRSVPACIDDQRERRQKIGCILWSLLETFQESLCQEIHDRVYGFIGLSSDCDGQGILVDYSKSVSQLYEDVMRFYHDKFKGQPGIGPPHGPQLVKLSEFLHQLLGPGLATEFASSTLRSMPESLVEISATRVVVIEQFLDSKLAEKYKASNLARFLQGIIPYSHLGHWRDLVSPNISEVHAIRNSASALLCHIGIGRMVPNINRVVGTKMLFLAYPSRQSASEVHYGSVGDGAVIGVAPEGTRLGDIVCTFLESRLALVFRPTSATTSSPGDGSGYKVLQGGSFSLVGRAIVDLLGGEEHQRYKTVLNPDKTVEIVQAKGSFIKGRDAPWPVTVSMDMPTLWLVTRSEANLATRGFSKAMLDLLPREDSPAVLGRSKPADEERDLSGLTSTQKFEREVLLLQSDPQLQKHALGPGSAGIVNLGSTGYISSTLQILYMLKPIRMVTTYPYPLGSSLALAERYSCGV
ncbi:heterokaryon incompatibility protein-domain-containing protein [Chaetomium sp. MPI-SDFR-AT-0129]|nr:heterokaryon incompatibility protein-domain-containing protein [Chaetomium sp. MPI-SDFR-AT-0129]